MEIKIQIPDNCELVKDENTYIVKEKKLSPPRSWDEFCEKFPVQMSKETNSNLVDDYEDSGSYINEETLEIFSQLEEPLPFSIKDFTPEPFIPTI